MKKIFTLIFTLTMVFMLVGCNNGNNDTNSLNGNSIFENSSAVKEASELATECLESLVNAKNTTEAAAWLTADSQDRAQSILNFYKGLPLEVKVEYKKSFKGYDIFYYEVRNTNTNELFDSSFSALCREGDKYLVCLSQQMQSDIHKEFLCKKCNGSGNTSTNISTACGICGGTGFQYIPNAYYDAALNMWMGQNMACSGCGGSGHIGGGSNTTCTGCNGYGLNFN